MKFTAIQNDFGFRLLAQLVMQGAENNLFLSPTSIAQALMLTYNGAQGATRRVMAETIGLEGMSLHEINQTSAALSIALGGENPKNHLLIANSLWAQPTLEFHPDFIQRCRKFYGTEVQHLDFSSPDALAIINDWVKQKTSGNIETLVQPEDLAPETLLLLLNAIYFKGMWMKQFDEKNTYMGSFTRLNGQRKKNLLMRQTGRFDTYQGDGFQAIILPYSDGRLSMYVFLPDENIPFNRFQKNFNIENWHIWLSRFRGQKGEIVLPRFQLEYETELSASLTALGMGIAFGSGANFAGMGIGPLLISKVRHKTCLEVNETGAEAAAAVAVVMSKDILPGFRIVVDRPFFFAIRENTTGLILFMGFVLKI